MTGTPKEPRLVVGVGASAGGLAAFKELLDALPDDHGMAFLLVQHLAPAQESHLAELLAPHTKARVVAENQGEPLAANSVYIIRPATSLAVRDGCIELGPASVQRGVRASVDHLFRSLAREYRARSVGIVLSGAGNDGSRGARDIKAAGGMVLAQDPETCAHPGMPQSCIATGAVDMVLDIADMPEVLERFANLPPRAWFPGQDDSETQHEPLRTLSEEELAPLTSLLEAHDEFDFRVYKPATIERRVLRRMLLSGAADLGTFYQQLQEDPSMRRALIRDFLISVTSFFRDNEAFEALRQLVIDPLVAEASPGRTLRIWVPGCATGEEAYALGMAFMDAMETFGKQLSMRIFATDIDQDALSVARRALYPASIIDDISSQRLQRYFTEVDSGGYQICGPLRDSLSFACHSLTKDPPFSRMDLVSCRNVMIYLRGDIRQRVLETLHFALSPEAHLFLGTSESTGSLRDMFSTVSKEWRIYQRVGASRPRLFPPSRRSHGRDRDQASDGKSERRRPPRRAPEPKDMARRAVLRACVSPTVVVLADGSVIFMHGDLRPFLHFPEGDNPRMHINALIDPRLSTRVRAAMYRCRTDGGTVISMSSPDAESSTRVRITAHPAPDMSDGVIILTFEHVEEPDVADQPSDDASDQGRLDQTRLMDQLERELQATREDLSNTVEELEASNEELRSSHEESMSMNEELQSANEELEATTEELRSLNEELTTVNAQLRDKIAQYEQAHDDLSNFFASTKIATVFLDHRLQVKRFTPAAARLLDITDNDVGRYIGDIARELFQHGLVDKAESVLQDLSANTTELRTNSGQWFTRTVLPYRTENRRIEGVVVNFSDITALKRATERLAIRERQQAVIARLGLRALKDPDMQRFLNLAVREVQSTLQTDMCMILELQPGKSRLLLRAGVGWDENLVGRAHIDAGRASQAGYTLHAAEPVIVADLATEERFSDAGMLARHDVVSGISCVVRNGEDYGVISAHTTSPRRFDAEDANFLQAVASVIGSALSRHQTRLRLELEGEVARLLSRPEDVKTVLFGVLRALASKLQGAVGEFWWPTDDGDALACQMLLVEPPLEHGVVEAGFSSGHHVPGKGLVGIVFDQGKALWTTDLGAPDHFDRRELAGSLGLVSGVAMPVRSGDEIAAVITMFSRERIYADDVALHSLENLGRAIGDFLRRAKAENSLWRLATITEASQDAIFSYDITSGEITEWLPGAARLYGYTAEEMMASPVQQLLLDDRRDEFAVIDEAVARGEPVQLDTVRVRKDGSVVEVSTSSVPIHDHLGQIVGVASTDRDMTHIKDAERKQTEASRQKDEFLAMLGHELRNPLAAMRSATQLLEASGTENQRVLRARDVLHRQGAHIARLLDGLLDIGRIIHGTIRLEKENVVVNEVCREVLADVDARLGDRSLDFQAEIPSQEIWIDGDRVRLAQIVDNLLSNAVKFTPDGGSVSLRLRHDGAYAELEISDTGVGVDPALLEDIFEVFHQSEQSLDRSQGGMGIGLALVKSLVELHGGEVSATSPGIGRGTRFQVRLPSVKQPARHLGEDPVEPGELARILVIEDNLDSAEMLAEILRLQGHIVAIAMHGQEGVQRAREERPDLILCDIGLPGGMSGFDVARELRADPDLRSTSLVAVTGYGRPEDKVRCTEAGFDAHLTKPIELTAIEQLLVEVARTRDAK